MEAEYEVEKVKFTKKKEELPMFYGMLTKEEREVIDILFHSEYPMSAQEVRVAHIQRVRDSVVDDDKLNIGTPDDKFIKKEAKKKEELSNTKFVPWIVKELKKDFDVSIMSYENVQDKLMLMFKIGVLIRRTSPNLNTKYLYVLNPTFKKFYAEHLKKG